MYDHREGDEGGEDYDEDEEDDEYYNSESDYEDDEEEDEWEYVDEGDSDHDEFDADENEIATVAWSTNNSTSSAVGGTFPANTKYNRDHGVPTTSYTREVVEQDGVGAAGLEGSHLSDVMRVSAANHGRDSKHTPHLLFEHKYSSPSVDGDGSAKEYTYGPGATKNKPWTSRKDGGINARGPNGRGDEIYFVGVIDILQQYNVNKKVETLYKVCGLLRCCSKPLLCPV